MSSPGTGNITGIFAMLNADFSQAVPVGQAANLLKTDGQLWIGTNSSPNPSGTTIKVGKLVSPLGTLSIGYAAPNITLDITGGSTAIEKIALQTGTTPISPTGGIITFNGATVAAGTHPVRTDGTGPNTMALEVQISQAIASTNATNIGLAAFDSARFTVDANGFVSVSGTGLGETITGNDGTVLSPTAGNWNIVGNGVSGSGISTVGNIYTTGSGSTLTINNTKAQFMTNYTTVNHAASPYVVLVTDNYIAVDCSAGTVTLNFPNAPTTNRIWVVKDKTGSAATNNISITTVGGSVTIDGQTTYKLVANYSSISLLFDGTNYEIY